MAALDDIKITLTMDGDQMVMTAARAGAVLRQLSTTMSKTAESTKNLDKHFHSVSRVFHDLVQTGGMLRFVMYDIRDIFQATAGFVIKSSGEIERMTKLMQGLSTESTKLGKEMDAIKNRDFVFNLAKNAPFEVKALTDAFIKLQSAGIDPTTGKLQTLVDSVARFGGTSDTLHRASIAIQQMAGKGVISMEELRQQLGEAVPTAMRDMATGMGMSMAEMVKHISKGEVAAVPALERMFAVMKANNAGAAAEMMETWVGQFEKLKTNLTLFANDIGNSGFFGVLKENLASLNQYFESSAAKEFAKTIGSAFISLANLLSDGIKFIVKYQDELKLLTQVAIGFWTAWKAGQLAVGVNSWIKAQVESYNVLLAKEKARIVGLNMEAQAIVEGKRAAIKQASALDEQRILNEIKTQTTLIANLKAAEAQKMAIHNAAYAKYQAADKVATTGILASGNVAAASTVARSKKIATAHFQEAMAAERAAVRIKAAYAGVQATAAVTSDAIVANTVKTRAALAAIGPAVEQQVTKIGMLRGVVSALGGPIGLITAALTLGWFAWEAWGDKAEKAANRAKDALAAVKAGYNDYAQAKEIADRIALLQTEIPKVESSRDATMKEVRRQGGSEEAAKSAAASFNKRVEDMKAEIAKLKDAEVDALRQASNGAIDDAKRINESRVAEEIRIGQSAIQRISDGKIGDLEKQLAIEKIAKDKFDKLKTDEIRDRAVKMAQVEIDAWKKNAELAKSKMDNAAKSFGTGSDKYKAFESQYLAANANKRTAEENLKAAQKIGTEFTDFIKKTDDQKGQTKQHIDWLSDVQNDILKLSEKYKGVAITAEQLKQFEGEARENVQAAYEEGKFDVVAGSGKNKTVTRPNGVPPGYAAIEAIKLAYKKYGADYEQEVNAIQSKVQSINSKMGDTIVEAQDAFNDALGANQNNGVKDNGQYEKFSKLFDLIESSADPLEKTAIAMSKFAEAKEKAFAIGASTDAEVLINQMNAEAQKINESLSTEMENKEAAFARDTEIWEAKMGMVKEHLIATVESSEEINRVMEAMANLDEARMKKHAKDMQTPLKKLAESWKDTSAQMGDAAAGWASKATDALTEFVKTGKLSFTDLAESIISDLLRIQMQKTMALAIGEASSYGGGGFFGKLLGAIGLGGGGGGGDSSGLGADQLDVSNWIYDSGNIVASAMGNVMTEFGPAQLRKYASGGIARSPQVSVFGEGSTPEAYVPLPDGRSIPVTMQGGNNAPQVVVNIVNNANGTQATETRKEMPGGGMQIDVIIDQVESKISRNVATGRGSLSGTMEKTYGLNRAAGASR